MIQKLQILACIKENITRNLPFRAKSYNKNL